MRNSEICIGWINEIFDRESIKTYLTPRRLRISRRDMKLSTFELLILPAELSVTCIPQLTTSSFSFFLKIGSFGRLMKS